MPDREKVIKGLEHEISRADIPTFRREWIDCVEVTLLEDAVTLLKAQEPRECENTNKARIFCCSVCGYEVGDIFIDEQRFEYPSINFCPYCGRAVKWE